MDTLLYWVARVVIIALQALPLRCVARLGRMGGLLAYAFDGRHRRVTLRNLTMCFGAEKSPNEIRALARENFKRIGENYACAIKTNAMSLEQLRPHVEVIGGEKVRDMMAVNPQQNTVAAIGHFGNFELYARYGQFVPPVKCATTYRGLKQPALNRLMQSLREKSGCLFFERRTEGDKLRAAMNQGGILLGLLADQHPGGRGTPQSFLGRECLHSTAPAVFALRYNARLVTMICFRIGLAQWRIEVGPEISTQESGQPRPVEAITGDMVRALEAAVRRDPANWFWVHNRWKPLPEAARRQAVA